MTGVRIVPVLAPKGLCGIVAVIRPLALLCALLGLLRPGWRIWFFLRFGCCGKSVGKTYRLAAHAKEYFAKNPSMEVINGLPSVRYMPHRFREEALARPLLIAYSHYNPQIKPMKQSYLTFLLAFAGMGMTALAVPITIVAAPSGGDGNVLFNVAGGTGTTLFGTLNSDPNFEIRFTSPTTLVGSGGQATLSADGPMGSTFDAVTISLTNNFAFTEAIFNLDVDANGSVQFTVNYLLGGSQFNFSTQTVGQNGQNFFQVIAGDGALITSISLAAVDPVDFESITQIRIGGATRVTTSVPEGGMSLAMLGMALVGLALVRKKVA